MRPHPVKEGRYGLAILPVVTQRHVGPWRICEELGRGGNARVYRAEHIETGEAAALKEINARRVSKEPYQRFVTEIRTLKQLGEYPGVLPVVDAHIPDTPSSDDQPWLVMPIAKLLRDALTDADLGAVVSAIGEIADTLARLRAEHGLAHRDLKPGNLYELEGSAVVGDFGLVALPDRSGLTQEGRPLGPANFIPFEMLNEPATANPFAADVYSLGKTLWVIACGVDYPPPGHQPASAAPHRIADYRPHPNARLLDELVDRATVLDPGSRPAMAEIAADLQAWGSLPIDERGFNMAEAAAAVRAKLGGAISETQRLEGWKDAAHAAARRYDELARPLNEILKAADPRAQINVSDQLTNNRLRVLEHVGSPDVAFHWTRCSSISAGGPVPYMLRMGRGLDLIEDGTLIIRCMIDLGLDGVMQTDIHWVPPERRVSVGSTQQEAVLQEITAELAAQLEEGLRRFAQNAPAE